MASAQVNVWLAVHSGLLDDVLPIPDEMPGDAAMARMMLHRRRAVVAQAVDEFLGRLGSRFSSSLGNRVPQALKSGATELEASKAAGSVAANLDGSAPPLLFERALLAEMEGRNADALSDLGQVLEAYPGFLSAAIAFARLALIDRDPGRAIGSLAYVERELVYVREGSALFADALHAVGMHGAASRYDLATLMCPDHAGSHGNDCAPVDMNGQAASDPRMPAAFIVDELPDGRSLCNDRGIYYVGRPTAGGSVAELMAFQRTSPLSAALRHGLRTAVGSAVAAGKRILRAAAHSRLRASLFLHYKRLPESLRYALNRYFLLPMRHRNKNWQRIPEQDWRSDIARARLRAGIARITQDTTTARTVCPNRRDIAAASGTKSDEDGSRQSYSREPSGRSNRVEVALVQGPLPKHGELPSAAAFVLDRLRQKLHDSVNDATL